MAIKYTMKLFTFLVFFTMSCVSESQIKSTDEHYKKELIFKEGDKTYHGFAVLPEKERYQFTFLSRKSPEKIRISNCHRDAVFAGERSIFKFDYWPDSIVERDSCIMHVRFLDKSGYHSFGAITFKSDEKLKSVVHCNGKKTSYIGASVCQAKVGTTQAIAFEKNDILVKSSNRCSTPEKLDSQFLFKIDRGFCIYAFKNTRGEYHRLTTFGYTDFISP